MKLSVTWITPVQLPAYNLNYSGSQSTAGVFGGTVSSRLAAFDKDGAFVAATAGTTGTTFGTVFVPINGTLFVQSDLVAGCGGLGCSNATLRSLKVTY